MLRAVGHQMGNSRQGGGARRRSRARSNGNRAYVNARGVRSAAHRQLRGEDAKPACWWVRMDAVRRSISRGLQGETWSDGDDQGRVRTAISRRYAHAAGVVAHHALLDVVIGYVRVQREVMKRASQASERGGGEGGAGDGTDGGGDGGDSRDRGSSGGGCTGGDGGRSGDGSGGWCGPSAMQRWWCRRRWWTRRGLR